MSRGCLCTWDYHLSDWYIPTYKVCPSHFYIIKSSFTNIVNLEDIRRTRGNNNHKLKAQKIRQDASKHTKPATIFKWSENISAGIQKFPVVVQNI